jgi:predicted nucleic acid-binding protein
LDTSALVKVYVEETHSASVRRWMEEATVVTTSIVAYPEAAAAFARKRRESEIEQEVFARVLAALDEDWANYAVVEIDERAAGTLAVKHGLRGFDAIHLAAALALKPETTDVSVSFCTFDGRLTEAAAAEGLAIMKPPKGKIGR